MPRTPAITTGHLRRQEESRARRAPKGATDGLRVQKEASRQGHGAGHRGVEGGTRKGPGSAGEDRTGTLVKEAPQGHPDSGPGSATGCGLEGTS